MDLADGGRRAADGFAGESRAKSVDAVECAAARPPYNFFARLLLPALGNYAKKVAHGQTAVNLARMAIALERYRLAHGEFPESLDALAPQFMAKMPHDVIGGQPLHYRRTKRRAICSLFRRLE